MGRYGCWASPTPTEVHHVRSMSYLRSPRSYITDGVCSSIGLSNGTLTSTITINKRNDLQFDALLTSDIIGTYKPGTKMYQTAIKALNGTGPGEIAMVAAHAYDTDAAAKQ